MTTITLPPDIATVLAEAALKQGTTPEQLALESLRRLFIPGPAGGTPAGTQTLFDFLSGQVGTISGSAEAYSENCGQRFGEGLAGKHARGQS